MNEARAIIQGMDDWLEDYYTKGDYLLEGIKGELYPCNKQIFEESYKILK